MTSTDRARARVSVPGPGELAALVPQLVGFVPSESLVAVSLRGRRRRVGLTLRCDLAPDPALRERVVRALVADGARSCVLVVHTQEPSHDRHPWSGLVDEVEAALAARGVDAVEVLLVRAGRWWSYRCAGACCPPQGTPLPLDSPVVRAVAAERAYDGRAVLAGRTELVASLQPRPPLGEALARRLQAQAADDLAARRADDPVAVVAQERERWRRALDDAEGRPGQVPPAEAAALAAALQVVAVRDLVASWALDRGDVLLALLVQLCGAVVPPDDAPLCAVLAWVAYAGGDGALALVAVERALATDPSSSLARLLLAAVDDVLPPEQLRAVLRAVPSCLP